MFIGLTFDRQLSYGICVHWSLGLKMSYKLLIKTFITTMLGKWCCLNMALQIYLTILSTWSFVFGLLKKEYVVTYESDIQYGPENHRILKLLIFLKTQLFQSSDSRENMIKPKHLWSQSKYCQSAPNYLPKEEFNFLKNKPPKEFDIFRISFCVVSY